MTSNDTATVIVPRAIAEIDLSAITSNCQLLRSRLTGGAELCAVVKADGYGHGMVEVARAAIAGGATRLAVVTLGEATALAAAGVDVPVLMMGPVPPAGASAAISSGAELTVWTVEQVRALAIEASSAALEVAVHVKLDTGMGRFGAREEAEAFEALDVAAQLEGVRPTAVWTHFATADEPEGILGKPGDGYFHHQLERFTRFADEAKARHPEIEAHAGNSAAVLREPGAHFDFARCGIAIYGLDPFHEDAADRGLIPALSLRSYVAALRPLTAGESAGYGRRFVATDDTVIATVPIGYGDGWRRSLSGNCDVLIGGRRFRQRGTVSMDSITIDIGVNSGISEGDIVTLIGRDGDQRITTEEVARRAQTINYEVTCGLSPRTIRRHVGAQLDR